MFTNSDWLSLEACKASELLRDWRTRLSRGGWKLRLLQGCGKPSGVACPGLVSGAAVHCMGRGLGLVKSQIPGGESTHRIGLAWVSCPPLRRFPLHSTFLCPALSQGPGFWLDFASGRHWQEMGEWGGWGIFLPGSHLPRTAVLAAAVPHPPIIAPAVTPFTSPDNPISSPYPCSLGWSGLPPSPVPGCLSTPCWVP